MSDSTSTTVDAVGGYDGTRVSPTLGVYRESYTWVLDSTTLVPVGVRKDTMLG